MVNCVVVTLPGTTVADDELSMFNSTDGTYGNGVSNTTVYVTTAEVAALYAAYDPD